MAYVITICHCTEHSFPFLHLSLLFLDLFIDDTMVNDEREKNPVLFWPY